MITDLAAFVH